MYAILFGRFKIPLIVKGFFLLLVSKFGSRLPRCVSYYCKSSCSGFSLLHSWSSNYRRVNLDV